MAEVEIKLESSAWGGEMKPCAMDNSDISEKLDMMAKLKPGDPFPVEFVPNNWGSAISSICAQARDEIESLRTQVANLLHPSI